MPPTINWVASFLAGVGATLIGFIFFAIWDVYKWRRATKKRQEAMLVAAIDELKNNIRVLKRNNELLTGELKIIAQRATNLNPLNHFCTGSWNLLKYNWPDFLIENDLIPQINSYHHLINEINEIIRSRENYRLNNEPMTNYVERLIKYDQLLIEQNNKFLEILYKIENKLT